MTMVRAYTNENEGVCCCFWEATSMVDLKGLFDSTGVAFDSMVEVREFTPASA